VEKSAALIEQRQDLHEAARCVATTVRAIPVTVTSPEIHRQESRASLSVPLLYREKVCRRQRKNGVMGAFQQLLSGLECWAYGLSV
jgi:hypothetical protein